MGKQLSGAQKRKKRKEKEELAKEAVEEMERLKLGPTELWTGLVLHHKDVFVSHVLPKLNKTDRNYVTMFTNVHPFRRWNWRGITCPGERKLKMEM